MLSQLLKRAEAGEALWLPELRAAFAADPGASPLILRLSCPDGTPRDYTLSLPSWKSEAEKDFLRGFLCAHVYNLLSAFSGREIRFFCDGAAAALAAEVPACFARPDGLGKVCSIARRICGELRFSA
ncbi:MAG: hypothetical protein J6P58_05290, partial [Oscillospiraceae bacterium]|nr:hypothetical protein [Oscillospiraceae bacterium]